MQTEVSARRASLDLVTGLLDRMLDGIVILDPAGRIVYKNPPAAILLGPACDAAHVAEALRRLAGRSIAEIELPSHRVAEISAVPIDWDGAPAQLLTLRDITERLQTQASLVVLTEHLRSANAHLQMLADVDPLTGLLNRRGLKRVLDSEVFPRLHLGFDLVAIMVDCDGFKSVNDTFDHVAGDLVLRQVGERIRSALRPGDPLARVGGDEFLVLLPGARHADALRVANRIREVVARSRIPIPFRQSEIALTVSVGVAQIPRHVRDVEDIITRADARLRQSKLAGKNRVTGPGAGEPEAAAPA
jgi:two-component system cell cycle response regulator